MSRRVKESDRAEFVGRNAQLAPVRKIGGTQDSVIARRTGDTKLKCAHRLLLREGELDRQRIGEHLNALILQRGDCRCQIPHRQRLGEHKGRKRIASEENRAEVRHVRRQGQVGQLTEAEVNVA